MEYAKQEIETKLIKILTEKLNHNIKHFEKVNYDEKFTGINFRFSARDLIYLYYMIEKEFSLIINIKLLSEYSFNSINDITQLIIRSKKLIDTNREEKADEKENIR